LTDYIGYNKGHAIANN